jgi:hypothetical protein
MDKSQRLFQEIQKLEATFREIEREEERAIKDRSLQEQVLLALTADHVLGINDPRKKEMWVEINSRKQGIDQKREKYRKENSRLSRELVILTRPVIRELQEKLHLELRLLKLVREIISQEYHGSTRKTLLTVKTNVDGIRKFREKIDEATKTLGRMENQPISAIRSYAEQIKKEVAEIDIISTIEKKIEENEFYRFQGPPQGNISAGYDGPLGGLSL